MGLRDLRGGLGIVKFSYMDLPASPISESIELIRPRTSPAPRRVRGDETWWRHVLVLAAAADETDADPHGRRT